MFIHLKVKDSESGSYYETEAILIGDGCAVYNHGGILSVEPVVQVNGGYEIDLFGTGTGADIFNEDPSIIDRISEMAAQDFIALCE